MRRSKTNGTIASTEEKIKLAARKVFTEKGFAATRTRDIAEAAGINLALLNYYFRSKQKLFDLIMMENVQLFIEAIKNVLDNERLTLNEKVALFVEGYIEMLKKNPDLPLFILQEIRRHPEKFANQLAAKEIFLKSHFFKQLQAASKGRINPVHIVVSMLGLTIFPFIAGLFLQNITNINQVQFDKMMDERKKLIPKWVDTMIKAG
ncbi:MAG: TetR/AcrR family transcriptional regulator [Crocinitomicaceae bacterium]|nr:TetR/AcrR family transcriptional regulator [Crocinitomicaceae bacterium]